MKFISRLALATTLAMPVLGAAAISPASAQEAEDAYKPDISKQARKPLGEAQAAVEAQDYATAIAKAREGLAEARTPDDRFYAGRTMLTAAQASNDAAAEDEALQLMVRSESPLVTANLVEQIYLNLANKARQAENPTQETAYYNELLQKQPDNINATIGLAEAMVAQGQTQEGIARMRSAIEAKKATGEAVPEAWYRRGFVLAYNNKLTNEMTPMGIALVENYPTPTNWRDVLLTYRDSNDFPDKVQLDIFRLLNAVDGLTTEGDYFEYASTAERSRYTGEADAALKSGISAGLISADKPYVKELSNLIAPRFDSDRSDLPNLAKEARADADGKLAAETATTYLGYGDNAKAAELYRVALEKGGVDASTINTRLGIALARQGDTAGARAAFEAAKGGQTGTLADFWLAYLNSQA